jgi:hypothetical protein
MAETTDALIADTQDAFSVGDYNHLDFVVWPIAQQRRNGVAQWIEMKRPRGRL